MIFKNLRKNIKNEDFLAGLQLNFSNFPLKVKARKLPGQMPPVPHALVAALLRTNFFCVTNLPIEL